MVQNGSKWFKMVKNGQNRQKWSKSPKMVKIAKNGQNGLKSSKMIPNGLKWSKMVPNGPKWFQMVQNGEKWSKSPKTSSSFHIFSNFSSFSIANKNMNNYGANQKLK